MTNFEKGQIITANRLRDGIAVFMTRSGNWSESIDDAALALEPQAAAALEQRAKDGEISNLVTGSYLIDAERREGHVRAAHIRERMRALGPTVRLDLGKQAEGTAGAFPAPEGA
ncbi:MAG: DUF2849 domain-containing protein [Alphaproteobacteria bacterium]|nr:DUF2849 domain-containing protein [Alphaproteobacteria bacterium]